MIEEISLIDGAFAYIGNRHTDKRGYFEERWNLEEFRHGGKDIQFVQSNLSVSFAGVLRGLHVQLNNPQGKLISVLHGQIYDVIYDLRKDSPTFKRWCSFKLHAEANISIYIPPGCAHGFFAMNSVNYVQYLCTTPYDKSSDSGVRWNDPELNLEWPFMSDFTPNVSLKDMELPTLSEFLKQR